jgi:hypothetical protein
MEVAPEDYRAAGINRRGDAVGLRQKGARQQEKEAEGARWNHH